MKRHGFTLAEVLITLGIIGVVAALTAPALVQNSSERSLASRLSVNVSNINNAMQNMLEREEVDSLFDTDAWTNYNNCSAFAGYLGQYLRINGFQSTCGTTAFSTYYSGSLPYALDANGAKDSTNTVDITGSTSTQRSIVHVITTNNGAVLFIVPNMDKSVTQAAKEAIIKNGGSLFKQAADVFIDVNGTQGPNIVGRDLFTFYLGDDGVLYPFGGLQVGIFEAGASGASNVWSVAKSGYSCVTGSIDNSGWGCTGRLIDEGYKVNY